ncbi:MAG: hydantoinase/oxoprolinase family protein, partial [Anaerolineae bacterium]|nr:hydantoinase/oxoprolinase family protein [Anaerolineae bacterium]
LAGRINPDYFLGGEIALDVEQARAAMGPISSAFDISVEDAAMGVLRIVDANMMNALKLVSVRRGYDPRDFTLIAFGGGGPLHGAALMRELRVKKTIIPLLPGVFSAWGMLMTDLRRDFIRTLVTRIDKVTPERLDMLLGQMSAQAEQEIMAEGIAPDAIVLQRHADMRYLGQEHTVKVKLPGGTITEVALAEISARFHALHEQTYTFRLDTPVELVNYHVTAFGRVQTPDIKRVDATGRSMEAARKGTRRVNFDELGFHEAAIYERDLLPVGAALRGPAVIEEPSSTTVVFPDQVLTRDEYGFLHIEMAD